MSSYVCPLPDYCVNREPDGIHINAQGEPIVAEIKCGQPIIINKMFGPLIFTALRVTADLESGAYIVERQRIDSLEWIEVARIPGQYDYEYDETHPEHREIPT